jgi:hypothetical protein
MITMIVSGYQTGVDIAAIRAAASLRIPTGGFMPKGFKTEAGPRPEYAPMYGARQHASMDYRERTRANAALAAATVWMGSGDSWGFGCTMNACRTAWRPVLIVKPGMTPRDVARWIKNGGYHVLNIAGNRESLSPGIEVRAEGFFREVFRLATSIGAGDEEGIEARERADTGGFVAGAANVIRQAKEQSHG